MKKLTQFLDTWPHLGKIVLGISVTLYTILTLFQINRWTIWFDEAFSAYLVRYDFGQIAHFTALDVHPPLYYWVLKCWTIIFGTGDIAMRSLSLAFGVVAIVLAYLLIRKLFDVKTASLAAFFLAISPMLIRYGQEARMYTMVVVIVLAASYVLVRAMESRKTRYWVAYALLVVAGMLTHYFVALAWVAHWVWRALVIRSSKRKGDRLGAFFSQEWLFVHAAAIALFIPWMRTAITQLTGVQAFGFWIGPVSADSLTNYLTTFLLFRTHDTTQGWWALAFYLAVAAMGVLLFRTHRQLRTNKNYLLVLCMVVVPLALLILMSMPPARSSYIERYILPSVVFTSLLLAVIVRYGSRMMKPSLRVVVVLIFTALFAHGIVYSYVIGNFNKSTNEEINTKQVATGIAQRSNKYEPVLATSAWTYYELAPYENSTHPVYYEAKSAVGDFGSLAMLKAPNIHKIENLETFTREKDTIWIVYESLADIQPPVASWKILQSFDVPNVNKNAKQYRVVQFQIR